MFSIIKNLYKNIQRITNRSISSKINFYVIPLVVIAILTVGLTACAIFSNAIREQIIGDNQKIIEQVGSNVDFYFNDIKTPMASILDSPYIIKALSGYGTLDIKEQVEIMRNIDSLTMNINIFKNYIGDFIIIGNNGFMTNLTSSPSILADFNFFNTPWMKSVISSNKKGISYIPTHVCNYYTSKSTPYDNIVSAVLPIRQGSNILGYEICDINMEKINSLFDSDIMVKGGYMFMFDENGKIIFHPDSSQIGKSVDSKILKNTYGLDSGNMNYKALNSSDMIVFSKSKVTGWILAVSIPYKIIYKPVSAVIYALYSILAICIIFVVILSYVISQQIKKPLNLLIERMEDVGENGVKLNRENYGYGEISTLGNKFENMLEKIDVLIKDVYLSQMRLKDAEFKALLSQVNPHFLYNTLQLIKAEAVFSGNKNINEIITSLGYLLHYSMNNDVEIVELSDEIQYIKHYLEIYKKRFDTKFDYSITVEPALENYPIPKLILQPIVENSIKHGFKNLKANCNITISGGVKGPNMILEIFDNGSGIKSDKIEILMEQLNSDEKTGGIGLSNVNQRIKIKYGDKFGLKIFSEEGVFTKVIVAIPVNIL